MLPILPPSDNSTLYLGLFVEMPDGTSKYKEVLAEGYCRQPIQALLDDFAISNISFGKAGESWGVVVGWGVFDEIVDGALLNYGLFNVYGYGTRIIKDDTIHVDIGTLIVESLYELFVSVKTGTKDSTYFKLRRFFLGF